ncbi:hypothetical protein LO763_06890 [Glycomyces sp. A-F 0318]|uniref:hypothetical protein n=1 Tax=Glycomyces amatae TaxID=2881355 RepID=UPI001E363B0E|nr:hypothetical protein [Glycomyces amatae]MCD0443351.1 hypothetical protein [Glycomyces amatae]
MHQQTGTRDVSYDLVSVLYHTLQEAATIQQYIDDAKEHGDEDAAGFFAELQEQDRSRAERAKSLLAARFEEQSLAARPRSTAAPAEGA